MKQKKPDIRISARVTKREQQLVAALAEKCGLSQSEYIKQRALGYEPKAALPDAFFHFCEQIDTLIEASSSFNVEEAAVKLLADMDRELLTPRKEDMKKWLPPASGQ